VQYFFSPRPTSKSLNLLDTALVEANRRGEITPDQAGWLKSKAWGGMNRFSRVALIVGVGFASLLFVFFALTTDLDRQFILIMGLVIAGLLGLVLLPRILRAIRDSSQLDSDRQGGLIRQAAGELAFDQGGYRAMAGDGALSLPASSNAGGLLPGVRYLFYYLEQSRFVLSAEEFGTGSASAVRKALAPILAGANRFADEDLQANRNGQISPPQRNRLLRKTLSGGISVFFGLVFAAAFALPYLLNGSLPENIASLAIPLAMMAYLLFSGGLSIYRNLGDALSGALETVQGAGAKSTEQRSSGRSRRTVYLYNIGNLNFEVPQGAYQALIDGLEYRAYYVPRTRQLLSIEPLDVPSMSFIGE
jgi:hypothetical protein